MSSLADFLVRRFNPKQHTRDQKAELMPEPERPPSSKIVESIRDIEREYFETILRPGADRTDEDIKIEVKEEQMPRHEERVERQTARTDRELERARNEFYRGKGQFVNRGLAHSSMFDERFNQHEGFSSEELGELKGRHGTRIAALAGEMELINNEFNEAMEGFELRLAADLERRLRQVTRDRDFAMRENERIMREHNVNIRAGNISESLQEHRRRMFDMALEFYKNLEKEEAIQHLEKDFNELFQLLGPAFAHELGLIVRGLGGLA